MRQASRHDPVVTATSCPFSEASYAALVVSRTGRHPGIAWVPVIVWMSALFLPTQFFVTTCHDLATPVKYLWREEGSK